MAADRLNYGEVVVTAQVHQRDDGRWAGHARVEVRRMLDRREVQLEVAGDFATQQEATTECIHKAVDWSRTEFPTK